MSFNSKRCEVCGVATGMACSDCAINTEQTRYVCSKSQCRDAHELAATCNPPAPTALRPGVPS